MSTTQTPMPVGAPRDQSVGLTLFGIFQILIGCFFLMMVPLILISATMAVTFWRLGLIQMYEQMGSPPKQLEMIRNTGIADTTSPICWFALATWAAMFGYLVYVRRYFSGAKAS